MELGNQPSLTASIVRPQHVPLQKGAFVRTEKLPMQKRTQQQPTVSESSLELKPWCPGDRLKRLGLSFWNRQLGKRGQNQPMWKSLPGL